MDLGSNVYFNFKVYIHCLGNIKDMVKLTHMLPS
jgi:hypothetical protein